MPEENNKSFPKDFLWGASTSAHQVEGSNHNQWTVWELAHAAEMAKHAGERMSIDKKLKELSNWPDIKDQAQDPNNYISGRGIDHYRRYEEDFDIAKSLNLNAFRFSIEWSRIEPEEGVWDKAELDHYKDYIAALKKRGLEPMLNLWHWTVPVWFYEKGDFTKRSNVNYFLRFVEKVMAEFAELNLKYVIVLNEPNVYTSFSYGIGEWPPQQKNWLKAIIVYANLISAQRRTYRILKPKYPQLQIGVAAQLANIKAKRPRSLIDTTTTRLIRYFWNWYFLNRIKRSQDFVGINFYFSDFYKGPKRENPQLPVNDLGWYMEPEGLYDLILRAWAHYKKPIIITENGVADAQDQHRNWWIEETMIAMEKALSEGVDLRGYFHWSLLDNFEWSTGWWAKFGLVEVDRGQGMKRTVRPSAKLWAERLRRIKSEQ